MSPKKGKDKKTLPDMDPQRAPRKEEIEGLKARILEGLVNTHFGPYDLGDVFGIDEVFTFFKPRNRGVAGAALRELARDPSLGILERHREGRYRLVRQPLASMREKGPVTSTKKPEVKKGGPTPERLASNLLVAKLTVTGQRSDEVFVLEDQSGNHYVARIKPFVIPEI